MGEEGLLFGLCMHALFEKTEIVRRRGFIVMGLKLLLREREWKNYPNSGIAGGFDEDESQFTHCCMIWENERIQNSTQLDYFMTDSVGQILRFCNLWKHIRLKYEEIMEMKNILVILSKKS